MSEPQYFFVYGSLMRGFFNYNKSLKGHERSYAPAKVAGVTLYHQTKKGYPAMIPGEGSIYGELITLDADAPCLGVMDEIENYQPGASDNEYDRRLTQVRNLETGEMVSAFAYWYDREDLGAPDNPVELLPDGDWRAYMESHKDS